MPLFDVLSQFLQPAAGAASRRDSLQAYATPTYTLHCL